MFSLNRLFVAALTGGVILVSNALAGNPASSLQEKIDSKIAEVQRWATEPAIVEAVAAQNAELPSAAALMTGERWKALSLLDPFVRNFTKNPAGLALREHRAAWVSEAFLSDAKGMKVAFLTKPTNWSHAGAPKHEVPMSGKTWQGPIVVDESSGVTQMQVAVPVLKDDHPIGSLVVGISPGEL